MSRRFFLVSYDITDDRRRTHVAKVLTDFGDRMQYSVFCCQLNPVEQVQLKRQLDEQIKHDDDQVAIVEAGPVKGQTPRPDVAYLGKTWKPEPRCQIV